MDDGLNRQAQIYSIEKEMGGVNVARADESGFFRLQEMANEIAEKAGVKPPDVLVADFNRYSEYSRIAAVAAPDEEARRSNHMFVFDRALANVTTEESLRGIIAHEIGHMLLPRLHGKSVLSLAKEAAEFGEKTFVSGLVLSVLSIAHTVISQGLLADGVVTAVEAIGLATNPVVGITLGATGLGMLAVGTALASAWAYNRGFLWQAEYSADEVGAKLTSPSLMKNMLREVERGDTDSYQRMVGEDEKFDNRKWRDRINKIKEATGIAGWTDRVKASTGIKRYKEVRDWAFSTHPDTEQRISYLKKLEKGEPPTDKGR